jgi:uncharacterized metal-binding protein YceD (DUF177 family)
MRSTRPTPAAQHSNKRVPPAFAVSIKGMQDGKYPVELEAETAQIADMFPEFTGTVRVRGEVRKLVKRFVLTLELRCDAALICDVSGEDFTQHVSTTLALDYTADTRLFLEKFAADGADDLEPPYYIREDDTSINITDIIRQELALALPLRRIAPAYRDTSFAAMHPEHSDEAHADGFSSQHLSQSTSHDDAINDDSNDNTHDNQPDTTDPRWAALKNIKF